MTESGKTIRVIIRAIVSLIAAAGLVYAGLFLLFIISFSSIHQIFLFCILPFVFLGLFLILLAWNIRSKKTAWVGVSVTAAALLITGCGMLYFWWTYDRYDVVRQNIKRDEYKPFAPNNKLVRVAIEESQKLSGKCPEIDGAYALYPVYAAAVQAICPKGDYDWTVQTNGSDVIFERLVYNEVAMIFSLAPSAQQLAEANVNHAKYSMIPIAKEAFVFFVNAKNPISNLTSQQIKDIYSGKITDWKDLGAPKNAKVIAFQRNKNSGSQTMLEKIMGDTPIMPPLKEDKLGGMADIIHDTANYRNYDEAIGFSFRYYATELMKNDKIKLLSIDGIAPIRENIANGTYPFIADCYIITVKKPTGNAKRFIDFMLSEQGREIIEKTGYVSYREK